MGRGYVETKNFISMSAKESIDSLDFLVSKFFSSQERYEPSQSGIQGLFALTSPRKKGSSAHQTHRRHCSLKPKSAKHSPEVVG